PVPNSAIAASWRWTARNVTAQYVPAWRPRNGSCVGPFDDPRTTKRRARIAPGPPLFAPSRADGARRHLLTAFFSTEPAEIFTPKPAGISIDSPMRGLRPVRAARSTRSTLSRPVSFTASPLAREDTRGSCRALRAASAWVLVRPAFSAIAATTSLRFSAMDWLLRIVRPALDHPRNYKARWAAVLQRNRRVSQVFTRARCGTPGTSRT